MVGGEFIKTKSSLKASGQGLGFTRTLFHKAFLLWSIYAFLSCYGFGLTHMLRISCCPIVVHESIQHECETMWPRYSPS